jgi:hypothetical protein
MVGKSMGPFLKHDVCDLCQSQLYPIVPFRMLENVEIEFRQNPNTNSMFN